MCVRTYLYRLDFSVIIVISAHCVVRRRHSFIRSFVVRCLLIITDFFSQFLVSISTLLFFWSCFWPCELVFDFICAFFHFDFVLFVVAIYCWSSLCLMAKVVCFAEWNAFCDAKTRRKLKLKWKIKNKKNKTNTATKININRVFHKISRNV